MAFSMGDEPEVDVPVAVASRTSMMEAHRTSSRRGQVRLGEQSLLGEGARRAQIADTDAPARR